MAELKHLTDQDFDAEVVDSDSPVLVDFWADWCQPCHVIAPEVKALAEEQAGKLKVAKLDIDANPQVASRYGVMSIPTLLLFVDGQEKARIVGAMRKDAIWSEIESHVINGSGPSS
jgi:thioredoxin 1